MCSDTHMGTYMLEQRCFVGSPECLAMREEPGWSGTSQQLLGQVVLCQGRGHALGDESCSGCLPSQRGKRSGRSREATPSGVPGHVFCFLSALLWESSNEAEKQNRGQGNGGCVMLLPCVQPLPVAPGIGEVVAGGLPEKEQAVS